MPPKGQLPVKEQIHENFKTFRGAKLATLGTKANTYLQAGNHAAKSIAVLNTPDGFVLSIGYRDGEEEGYSIGVVEKKMKDTTDLDAAISKARGDLDVICHSLYSGNDDEMRVVFLVHKD